jgi:hypothetical protein
MPAGLYMLLIYDGSEGGQHYTWDYFHVLGPEPATSAPSNDDEGVDPLVLGFGLAGAAIGVLGLVAAFLYRRRLTRRSLSRQ